MNATRLRLLTSAALLSAAVIVVAFLSRRYAYDGDPVARPTREFVVVLMVAAAAYLAAVHALVQCAASGKLLWFVFGFGAVLRIGLFFSTPILEDDYYRYLWDGGVVAQGYNPYTHAPRSILRAEALAPTALVELGRESGKILPRVNHPELATIYPPVAQIAFAAAHFLGPWKLSAWRGVVLFFDSATFVLLLKLLTSIGRPAHLAAIYWWNPVVLKETINSAHMDVLALPFVLAALIFALKSQRTRAAVAGSIAIGAKLWPLLLVPFLARATGLKPRTLVKPLLVFALVAGLLVGPLIYSPGIRDESGIAAYGERWEMNDGFFLAYRGAARLVARALSPDDHSAISNQIARGGVLGTIITILIVLSRRPLNNAADLCRRIVLFLGAVFLLLPAQFPWYYTWVVPFLALAPRPSLLLLTLTLPLYYLKFFYDARGQVEIFHNIVVWFEYVPVYALLAYELWRERRMAR